MDAAIEIDFFVREQPAVVAVTFVPRNFGMSEGIDVEFLIKIENDY